MTKYINKADVVAEIEKRRMEWLYGSSIEAKYKKEECDDILSLLNTLEVKEEDYRPIDKDFERAAIAAMQGILCSPIVEGVDPNPSQEQVAKWAIMQADVLIEELKNNKLNYD